MTPGQFVKEENIRAAVASNYAAPSRPYNIIGIAE